MKCPVCNTDLVPAKRHGVDVEYCPTCKGMWLTAQELDQLENEVFDFGDDEKGTLAFNPEPTTRPCPECSKLLKKFDYRFYDLQMEFCEDGHGYWLDEDEDNRVLELMKEEEKGMVRKYIDENRWGNRLNFFRSGGFLKTLRGMLE